MWGHRRSRLHAALPALLLVTLLSLSIAPGSVTAETVVLDHFMYGNTNATVNFTHSNYSTPTELHIDIPRGAAVIDANVSVRGIEGPGMANTTMDYSTHAVGPDMWAVSEGATGIVPLDVDPYNTSWDAMPPAQASNLAKVDGRHWHTQTPTVPSSAPWEWPVQLFHFRPDIEDATRYEISWRGRGHCAANTTVTKYHASMWLYNFESEEWDSHTSYWDWEGNDTWLNNTAFVGYCYVSSNGSIAVAVSGVHAEVDGAVKDRGHLYTDYMGLVVVASSTQDEFPKDVTLLVFDTYMRVADGQLSGTVVVDRTDGLASAIQDHIDHYPNNPGNVTVPIEVYVAHPTFARVEVFGLRITYDDTGVIPNDPPEWVGPSKVDLKEDSGWKAVLDMDLAFTDDYDRGDLQFSVVDISSAYLDARLRDGPLGHTWLEVRPADDFHGSADVTLGATDSGGKTGRSPPVTVEVQSVPDPPFMVGPNYVPANESERLNFTLLVLDPDMPDDELTFSDTSDLFDVDPLEGSIDWTPGPEHVGTHSCQVTVRDSFGLTDRMTLVIEVRNVNDAPRLTSPLTVDALEGQEVRYTITAEDPDLPHGDALTYYASSFDVFVQVSPTSGLLTFPTEKGFVKDVRIFVRVTDTLGASDEATLTVRVGNVNDPPTMSDPGRQTHEQGDQVSLRLSVEDPDLELELPEPEAHVFTSIGPTWLAADEEGWVNLTVEQHMVGEHLVTYTVTDSGGLDATVSVIWSLRDVNDVPAIVTQVPDVVTAREDEPFTLDLEASDLDGDALTWSDDSPLFDIGASSGRISFTPRQGHVGTHVVNVEVSDGRGGTASVSFELRVENVNDDPLIESVSPPNGTFYREGRAVRLLADASDEDGDDLAYVWRSGSATLGEGSDLLVEGLATGTHIIVIEVTDGNGGTASRTLDIVVRAEEVEDGPGSSIYLLLIAVAIVLGVVALVVRSRSRG